MDPAEVLAFLVELSREAGLQVRGAGPAPGDPPVRSGVCRLRDGIFVILAAADPVEDRIAALVGALREHRPEALEGRYLPPAVRERVETGPA